MNLRKRWYVLICGIGLVLITIGFYSLYQYKLQKEREEKQTTQTYFENQQRQIEIAVQHNEHIAALASAYIHSHTIERVNNLDIVVPTATLESSDLTNEELWLLQHEKAIELANVDMWLQLFPQETFQTWYNALPLEQTPEHTIQKAIQQAYRDVAKVTYFQKNNKPYYEILYMSGRKSEWPFPAINDYLQVDILMDTWLQRLSEPPSK